MEPEPLDKKPTSPEATMLGGSPSSTEKPHAGALGLAEPSLWVTSLRALDGWVKKPSVMLSCIWGPLAGISDPAERTSHLLGALITFFVAEFKGHIKWILFITLIFGFVLQQFITNWDKEKDRGGVGVTHRERKWCTFAILFLVS